MGLRNFRQEDSSQGIQVCSTEPYLPEHVSYLGPTAIIYVIAHNTNSIPILCKTSTLEKSNSKSQQAIPREKGDVTLYLCRPLLFSTMKEPHSPFLHTWDLQADSEEEGQNMDRRTGGGWMGKRDNRPTQYTNTFHTQFISLNHPSPSNSAWTFWNTYLSIFISSPIFWNQRGLQTPHDMVCQAARPFLGARLPPVLITSHRAPLACSSPCGHCYPWWFFAGGRRFAGTFVISIPQIP